MQIKAKNWQSSQSPHEVTVLTDIAVSCKMLSKLIILSDIQLMMKITLKMSRSTSAEPFLILLKGTKNLSLNRGDKKCHKKS